MARASGGSNGDERLALARQLTAQLAAELRELRTRSGKSLRELERVTLSSDSSLSRYLAGRTLPPWQVVQVLSEQGSGDQEELRRLWTRAGRAQAQAQIAERPSGQPAQETEPPAPAADTGRAPIRLLVALAAVAGLVGIVARRRLARTTTSA